MRTSNEDRNLVSQVQESRMEKYFNGHKTTSFIDTGSDGITICISFSIANSTLLSSGKTLKLCLRWKGYYQPGMNTASKNWGVFKALGDRRALFQLCLLSREYSDCHTPNCNRVTKWQKGQLFSGIRNYCVRYEFLPGYLTAPSRKTCVLITECKWQVLLVKRQHLKMMQ